jgi:hypothetical protein
MVSSDNSELVLHIGDISYSVGYLAEWDNFLAMIERGAVPVTPRPARGSATLTTCLSNRGTMP